MPLALVLVGIVLLVAAVRNTQDDLFTLLKGDFTGPKNFLIWILVFLVIGGIGRIPRMKPISNAFLVLIVVVIFLSNRGFFNQFTEQIKATTAKQPTNNQSSVSRGGNSFDSPYDAGASMGGLLGEYLGGLDYSTKTPIIIGEKYGSQ